MTLVCGDRTPNRRGTQVARSVRSAASTTRSLVNAMGGGEVSAGAHTAQPEPVNSSVTADSAASGTLPAPFLYTYYLLLTYTYMYSIDSNMGEG